MFDLKYKDTITIHNIPIQWIPKIELYYPDLPQFPIMYIHVKINNQRLISCPVSVNYTFNYNFCNATFVILSNLDIKKNPNLKIILQDEISERIGIKNKITLDTITHCCNKNVKYESLMKDLWKYIEKSYGASIPYGRFYEEIYSIPRFVAAWQPKTGRQSEMRMLYNFMSSFGQEVSFPKEWSHLEYYVIPTYIDVQNKDYTDFPIFKKLYNSIKILFESEFSKKIDIEGTNFNVMPKAWKQNKEDFIQNVSNRLYHQKKFTKDDKFFAEKLVDVFNRHAWRAEYFISAFLNIENTDYKTWSKSFFEKFYESGPKLKGYSEKVIACFLQQGFAKSEIIPIDTWIQTFYEYPLGIKTRSEFYNKFSELGKMERVIWLASQSNKTNMKNFFDILWCQRYGVTGNSVLRGINPLACYECKLNKTCVGLNQILKDKVYIKNNLLEADIESIPKDDLNQVSFICSLEEDIPKKIYKKSSSGWFLNDEFSGYIMTEKNKFNQKLINKQIITVEDFIKS